MSDIYYSAYRALATECSTDNPLQQAPTPEAVAYIDAPTQGLLSSAITVGMFIAAVMVALPHL